MSQAPLTCMHGTTPCLELNCHDQRLMLAKNSLIEIYLFGGLGRGRTGADASAAVPALFFSHSTTRQGRLHWAHLALNRPGSARHCQT